MIYMIRHGKTDWNAIRRLQGQSNIPLNEEGREQARAAGAANSDVKIDVCYCSPLDRARETAELFLEGRDVEIICDDRLKEVAFGEFEGFDKYFEHPETSVYTFFYNPGEYVAEKDKGAESIEELNARTGEFIREVLLPEHAKGKNILIVGHGAMNCSLVNQLEGIPKERFWERMTKNCQLFSVNI